MERSPVRDLIVGIFVLAGLAAIAYLSISIGGFDWRGHGRLKLYALFNETGDLTVRSPVVIAGVHVGEVSKVTLTDDFRARVDMDLRTDLQLSQDTYASIVTSGMLGDRYIELSPGGDDKILKTGDEMTHTENAVILEKLIKQLVYGITKDQQSDSTKPAATSTSAPARAP
jgi:phospholipid/cholesterol/gamma-HCH transport system substrate-binding protein